jgi:glycosyltransferase involved in cell wall biosynthesis
MQGVPIVAAASEGPLALIEDGVNGIVVALEDERAMAGALARLAGDAALAARLSEAGRQTYEKSYTPEAVVPRYIGLFERLAG